MKPIFADTDLHWAHELHRIELAALGVALQAQLRGALPAKSEQEQAHRLRSSLLRAGFEGDAADKGSSSTKDFVQELGTHSALTSLPPVYPLLHL